MPDLAAISVSKSSSMTDMIHTTLNDTAPPAASIWGGSAFSKSLSSTAIIPDQSIRGGSNFGKSHHGKLLQKCSGNALFLMYNNDVISNSLFYSFSDYGAMVSPTDIEFDQKMEDQVQALDKQNSDESDSMFYRSFLNFNSIFRNLCCSRVH